MRRLSLTLSVLGLLCLLAAAVAAAERGRLVGGSSYALPGWFKQSFLELADDASEAAEADKHVLLFMHLDGCPYCDAVLRESLVGADYSAWLRQRFDVIAINVRGSREVAFDATTRVSEKQLAELLKVRQT
ncbi:MAG TPA: thioredoxin fold domain-containing protein, partial [Gammaproteobacteria bacterium]